MFRTSLLALTLVGATVATGSANDIIRLNLSAKPDVSAPTQTLQLTPANDAVTEPTRWGRWGGWGGYYGGWHGYRGWNGGFGYRPWYGGGFGYRPWYGGFGGFAYAPRFYGGFYPNYGFSTFYPSYGWGYSSYSVYYPPVVFSPCASTILSVPSTTLNVPAPAVAPAVPNVPQQETLPTPRPAPPAQSFPYDGGPKAPMPLPTPDAAPPMIPPIPAKPAGEVGLPIAVTPKKVTYPAYGEHRHPKPTPPTVVKNPI
jgi:hypothetical protein